MRFSSVALRVLLGSWLVCDLHGAFLPLQQPRPVKNGHMLLHRRQNRGAWGLYQAKDDKLEEGEFSFGDMFKFQSSPEARAALGVSEEPSTTPKPPKGDKLTPRPPEKPPSVEVISEQQQSTPPPPPTPPPPKAPEEKIEIRPLMDEKTKEEMGKAAKVVKEKVVDPVLSGEFEKGVPQSTILASSLFCAILAFTTTLNISCAATVLFTVGFFSITSGPLGEAARTIGDITVDATERILIFLQEVGAVDVSKILAPANNNEEDIRSKKGRIEQIRKVESEVKEILKQADKAVAGADGQMEEIQRLQAEVRNVLKDADDVISNAVQLQEDSAQYVDDVMAQEDYLEEKASLADEEIARIAEEAHRIAEEAEQIAKEAEQKKRSEDQAEALAAEERARAKAEAIAKEAEELAQEARRVAEQEAQLAEEAKLATEIATADQLAEDGQRLAEEARLAEESAQQTEDEDGEFTDDDWEASIDLAQGQIDQKIVGINEGETDETTKANWNKAERLAQSLGGDRSDRAMIDQDEESPEEDEESPEEEDMEALAKAARAAVEQFEKASSSPSKEWQTGKSDDSYGAAWETTMGGQTQQPSPSAPQADEETFDDEIMEDDDWDPTIDDEMLPFDDGDESMEELAAAARAAVEMSQQQPDDDDDIAAAARAAVEMAEQQPFDDGESLEELAAAARAAVEMSQQQPVDDIAAAARAAVEMAEQQPFDDGESLEELAAAARAAVEMSQQQPVDDIAAAARAAVEMAQQQQGPLDDDDDIFFDDDEFGDGEMIMGDSAAAPTQDIALPSPPTVQNWSKLKVSDLKEELKSRGLPAYGKKKELIAALEADDQKQQLVDGPQQQPQVETIADDFVDLGSAIVDDTTASSSAVVDDEIDFSTMDMDELGRAAREAAAMMFDGEEPSDEVLMQLENEAFNFDDDDEVEDEQGGDAMDSNKYLGMTVVQLKAELKDRGLKTTGKKAELIARLQSAE